MIYVMYYLLKIIYLFIDIHNDNQDIIFILFFVNFEKCNGNGKMDIDYNTSCNNRVCCNMIM